MSLQKASVWMQTEGRLDISEGRSQREREVLDRICRIGLDLDGVMLQQGAKAGQGREQHDLSFGRKVENRKTPILFAGVVMRPASGEWFRRTDVPAADTVRLYVKISEAGAMRSPWVDMVHDDDSHKPNEEWRFFEIPERVDVNGDELLDLMEDAYFEVVGI